LAANVESQGFRRSMRAQTKTLTVLNLRMMLQRIGRKGQSVEWFVITYRYVNGYKYLITEIWNSNSEPQIACDREIGRVSG
jgi:hypothetical protein